MPDKLTSTNYTYINLVALSVNGLGIKAIIEICQPSWDRNGKGSFLGKVFQACVAAD